MAEWRVCGVGGNMTCRGQPRRTRPSILIVICTPSLPGLVTCAWEGATPLKLCLCSYAVRLNLSVRTQRDTHKHKHACA